MLAGGESRRFGSPKEAATLGGRTLLEHALRSVAPCSSAVGVVGTPAVTVAGVPVRGDLRPGMGPLGGLHTALVWAAEEGREGVAVLACDLPMVTAGVLSALAARWREGEAPARTAVVAGQGAHRQPLCGVYGSALAEELASYLDAARGLQARRWLDGLEGLDALREMTVEELAVFASTPPEALLLNVNRDEDRARARLLLDRVPPVVSIAGWKDSGKTTVAVKLVSALSARGLDVVALKHGHKFRMDTPGTDSWRLRHDGGARRVVLVGPEDGAVMGDWGPAGEPTLQALIATHAPDADIVVAEGWRSGSVPAIEVRRPTAEGPLLHRAGEPDADRFVAIVGRGADEPPDDTTGGPPRLDLADPELGARLADLVMRRLLPDRLG